MPRAMHPCPSCSEPTRAAGRCADCTRNAEQQRGTFRQRGYGRQHDTRFKRGVLRRDPTCTCTTTQHGHPVPCGQRSTDADHWPRDRRQLIADGADADDPRHGRGLCHRCHSRETALHQPGGWNRRA